MRPPAVLWLGLAAALFLAFPVVSLLGGWHGSLVAIGLVTFAGYAALACHAGTTPLGRFRVVAIVAFLVAGAFGLLLIVSYSMYLELQGNFVLFLLAAIGTAALALDSHSLASWFFWATAAAWLAEGLVLSFVSPPPVGLVRTLDGVAAAGLIAAFVCAWRSAPISPAQSL